MTRPLSALLVFLGALAIGATPAVAQHAGHEQQPPKAQAPPKPGAADTTDPAAQAARKKLEGVLADLNPAAGKTVPAGTNAKDKAARKAKKAKRKRQENRPRGRESFCGGVRFQLANKHHRRKKTPDRPDPISVQPAHAHRRLGL